MRRVLISLSAVAVLVAGAALPAARAGASYWCSEGASAPCIESATRAGAAVTATDPVYDLYVLSNSFEGSTDLSWGVQDSTNADPYELGAAERANRWAITFDVGSVIPRVVFARGSNLEVTRTNDGDGTWHVTVRANPVIVSGECDQSSWPWTCDEVASAALDRSGYLEGNITDYGSWSPEDQRNAMMGMNYATNVAATSLPPEVVSDSTTGVDQLLIRLANPHYRSNGTTVFRGFVELRIPNQFLRLTYGVNDPAAMTGSGLVVTGEGTAASASIYQESGDDAMRVEIADMTFSARAVKIKRGDITPTRPTDLRAFRLTEHRGKVGFDLSRSRGSRITGYKARCEARRGSDVELATAEDSPIIVTGLASGIPYDCRVKALSKAGPSAWSALIGIPGQPS